MAEYRVPNILGFEWQKSVLDKDLATPPSSPNEGDRYLIASGATDDWLGHDGDITWYENGAWYFIPKKEGMFVYVKDEDKLYYYNGSSWQEFASANGGSDSDWVVGDGVIYNLNDKVGIGTDSPSEALEVNGSLKVTGDWYWLPKKNVVLHPLANDDEWSFDLMEQNSYSGCCWQVWSDAKGSILVVRGDTGNVGIGKKNPNPSAKLDVNGDVYFGSYSKSTNGYTKLPNGLILQWGCFTSDTDDDQTINFPITFPNAVFCLVGGHFQRQSYSTNFEDPNIGVPYAIKSLTTSSFVVNRDNDVSDYVKIHWLAIGY